MDYEVSYLSKSGKIKRKIVTVESEDQIVNQAQLQDGDVVEIVGIKYASDKGKETK